MPSMFTRTRCGACGRLFFGKGRSVPWFDNRRVIVCGERCATAETARADRARAEHFADRAAKREAWADSLRGSVASGGWHRLVVEDGPPAQDDIARVGGTPLGIEMARWPQLEGVRAIHLCTFPGAPFGLPYAGIAVFAMRQREDGFDSPTGECITVPIDDTSTIGPCASDGLAPDDVLAAAALTVTEPPPGWDPTDREQESRSFFGREPVTFEGESLYRRLENVEPALSTLGRFWGQIDGQALPWRGDDIYSEIAGIYLFEHGALIDTYG